MEFDSVKLLHRLGDTFKEVKLPFHVKMVERVQRGSGIDYCHPTREQYMVIMDITTTCTDEQLACVREFARNIRTETKQAFDFQDLEIDDYFHSREEAYDFTMGLNFRLENIHHVTIRIGLEENGVNNFIERFRHKTEPLRLKIYDEEFDSQVEDHLSKDEYNLDKDDDGHK